jgi:hypothetical protein
MGQSSRGEVHQMVEILAIKGDIVQLQFLQLSAIHSESVKILGVHMSDPHLG